MDRTLISVPVLCYGDCTAVFRKHNIQVFKNNEIIIEGSRDSEKNLWLLQHKHNNVNNNKDKPTQQYFLIQLKYISDSVNQQKLIAHLQAWYHAASRAPVVTTLIRAINSNWVTSFPRLTAYGIYKHLPKTIQTIMG